jgi:hypothetical protein
MRNIISVAVGFVQRMKAEGSPVMAFIEPSWKTPPSILSISSKKCSHWKRNGLKTVYQNM